MRSAQKIAELGEDRVETFFRLALRRHQDDFPAEFADTADFFVKIEKIGGDDFGFDAVGGRGTGPAHGINRQRMADWREQFRFGLAARPAFPHGPLLRVDILQADGFHLGEAPVDGFLPAGSAGDAGADFVAEFGEVLEGVGVHGAFTGDFDEGGKGAVLLGAFGLGYIVGLDRLADSMSPRSTPSNNSSSALSLYALESETQTHDFTMLLDAAGRQVAS